MHILDIRNNHILKKDAKEGIIKARHEISNKQLGIIIEEINNELFEKILMRITSNNLKQWTENQLKNILTRKEYDNLPNFIDKMKELNTIKQNNRNDNITFEIKDELLYSYYKIKAFEIKYNSIPN